MFVVCFAMSDKVRVSDCLVLAEVALKDVVNVNVVMPGHVRLSDGQISAQRTLPLLFHAVTQPVFVIGLATRCNKLAFVARVHFDRSGGGFSFLWGRRRVSVGGGGMVGQGVIVDDFLSVFRNLD